MLLCHCSSIYLYVYILTPFLYFSSAFNTIVPSNLITKIGILGLNASLCNWILNFLMGLPQGVRVVQQHIRHTDPQHRAPQGCVLSPLL